MSISASIELRISKNDNEKFIATDLINDLVCEKWSIVDEFDEITILPLHDDNEFNWTTEVYENVFSVVDEKQKKGETIGITLFYDFSKVGCEMLIIDETRILFSLSINRRVISESDVTDFNWYLKKILPALSRNGQTVESIVCTQQL